MDSELGIIWYNFVLFTYPISIWSGYLTARYFTYKTQQIKLAKLKKSPTMAQLEEDRSKLDLF